MRRIRSRETSITALSKPAELISSASSISRSSGSESPRRLDRVVEDPHGLRASVEPEERAAELERDPRAPQRRLDRAERLLEVLGGRGDVHALLGKAELQERIHARVFRRAVPRAHAAGSELRLRERRERARGRLRAAKSRRRTGRPRRGRARGARRRAPALLQPGRGSPRRGDGRAASRQARSTRRPRRARRGGRTRRSVSRRARGRRGPAHVAASEDRWRSSSSASAAASRSSAPSPSTAAATASRLASAGSRESRSVTARATASGPISRTRRAFSAVGAKPSPCIASRIARRKSGLPPVAAWQAATNASSGSTPNSSRASRRDR